MIQAAGHHGAVAQNADLIPQAVAEARLSLILSPQVGPLEPLRLLQIELLSQLPAAGTGLRVGQRILPQFLPQESQDLPVALILPADIPQPQGADDPLLRRSGSKVLCSLRCKASWMAY